MVVRVQSETMTTTGEAPTTAEMHATADRNGPQLRWRDSDLPISGIAGWPGALIQHLQQIEVLAAGTTRCLSHAVGIYPVTTTWRNALPSIRIHSEGTPGGPRCRR